MADLTPEDRERERQGEDDAKLFRRHMNRVAKHSDCPVCEEKDWAISDRQAVYLLEGTKVRTSSAMAILPLVCRSCGFVRQFSLLAIQRLPPDQDTEQDGGS